MTIYRVKRHKGRSGKSVYEWRVYATYDQGFGRRSPTIQLGKFRNREAAEAYHQKLEQRHTRVSLSL